jgi:hypothetical protein
MMMKHWIGCVRWHFSGEEKKGFLATRPLINVWAVWWPQHRLWQQGYKATRPLNNICSGLPSYRLPTRRNTMVFWREARVPCGLALKAAWHNRGENVLRGDFARFRRGFFGSKGLGDKAKWRQRPEATELGGWRRRRFVDLLRLWRWRRRHEVGSRIWWNRRMSHGWILESVCVQLTLLNFAQLWKM